jgi:ABC-2 type transport system ATP-binding protein
MHRPKVLFLDEPTSGLDAQSRRGLWQYLKQVREDSGTTFCLTTHYLEEAEQVDRVCIINKGQVVAYGTPLEVKANLIDEYLLIDAGDRVRLRLELQAHGIMFVETPLFKIGLNGTSAHELLKTIETQLSVIQTHLPTLEDAYLSIVGSDDEA